MDIKNSFNQGAGAVYCLITVACTFFVLAQTGMCRVLICLVVLIAGCPGNVGASGCAGAGRWQPIAVQDECGGFLPAVQRVDT